MRYRKIHYPFRGEPLPSTWSMLERKRNMARIAATLRHRTYAFGFAASLSMWKGMTSADCWSLGQEVYMHRPLRIKRGKRPNMALERLLAKEVPF
jgi:hypothetical protein